VHYAGVACDMDKIMAIAGAHNLLVIEDAAQAVDSYYKGKPLGSIGHLAAFSFHETKNINAGEGGLLAINDEKFIRRAEIIWEKGTNRAEFFRGEVDKYGWKDTGSSFLPSEIIAAYLWAQIENLDEIQEKRKMIWEGYYTGLKEWAEEKQIRLPQIPGYATNNGHMFYLVCNNREQRDTLIAHFKENGVLAVFHYLSLHKSEYYTNRYRSTVPGLTHCEKYTDCLVRLPFYYELTDENLKSVISIAKSAF